MVVLEKELLELLENLCLAKAMTLVKIRGCALFHNVHDNCLYIYANRNSQWIANVLPVFIADVLYNVGQYIKRELHTGNNACMVSYDNTADKFSVIDKSDQFVP